MASSQSGSGGEVNESPEADKSPLMLDDNVKGRVTVNEILPGFQVSGLSLEHLEETHYRVEEAPGLFWSVLTSPTPSHISIDGIGAADIKTYCPILLTLSESHICRGTHSAGITRTGAGCHISPDCLERFAHQYQEEAFERLANALRSETKILQLPPSGRLLSLVNQMLDHPYEGGLGNMFLEGCALSFMAELGHVVKGGKGRRLTSGLSRQDYDRTQELRKILDDHIVNPPSLNALSRQLAVNVTTMSKQFSQVFGMTIFKYVGRRRLEIAQALLQANELPVSQVGYRVGFNNPGAFATAYRRHFGYAPSDESARFHSPKKVAK